MDNETLTPVMSPASAAKDFNIADALKVDVTTAATLPKEIKADALSPVVPEGSIADQAMKESVPKASAIAPDAEKLTALETFTQASKLEFKSNDYARIRSELALQASDYRARGQQVPKSVQDSLDFYRSELELIGEERSKLSEGTLSQAGTSILNSFRDMGIDASKHPALITNVTAAGAVTAALAAGGPAPIPWLKGAGLIAGASTGFGVGIQTAGWMEQSKRVAGEVIDELETSTNKNGNKYNIPENIKQNIGWAAGALVAGIDVVGEELMFDAIPALKGIAKNKWGKVIAEEVTKPVNRSIKNSFFTIGKALLQASQSEGITEAAQSIVQANFTELAKSWQQPDGINWERFTNSMVELMITDPQKRAEFWSGIGEEYKVASVAGLMTAGFGNIRETYDLGKQINEKLGERGNFVIRDGSVTTPSDAVVKSEENAKLAMQTLENGKVKVPTEPDPVQPIMTDANGVPMGMDLTNAINLGIALQAINNETSQFKIAGSPVELNNIRTKLIEQTGTKNFWVDAAELQEYAKTEEQKALVGKILLDKDAQVGARIPLSIQEFLELNAQNEKITEIVSNLPDAPTVKDLIKGIKEGKAQGEAFLKAAGAKSSTDLVMPESTSPVYVYDGPDTSKFLEESTDEEIASFIGSQEDAEKALDELQREENMITGKGQLSFPGLEDRNTPPVQENDPKFYNRTVDITTLDPELLHKLEGAKSVSEISKLLYGSVEGSKAYKIFNNAPSAATELTVTKNLTGGATINVKVPGLPNIETSVLYRGFAGKQDLISKGRKVDIEGNYNLTEGTFLTDSVSTAQGYAKQRSGATGLAPMIFKTELQGKILDLTDKVPEDLMTTLKARLSELQSKDKLGTEDNIEYNALKKYLHQGLKEETVNDSEKYANYTTVPNIPAIQQYAESKGFAAVRFPDNNYGNSVSSVYVYDPKNLRYFNDEGDITHSPESQQRLKDIERAKAGIAKAQKNPDLPKESPNKQPESKEEFLTKFEETDALLDDYIQQPLVTAMIAQSMNPKAIVDLHEDYLAIRKKIAEATKQAAKNEMDKVVDVLTHLAEVETAQEIADNIVLDPNTITVDLWSERNADPKQNVKIDPASLNDAQKAAYSEDDTLKARKAFDKKKGRDINELALEFGVSADDLLHSLAKVLTKAEAIEKATQIKMQELETEIVEAVDVNKAAIVAVIDDKQKMALKEIKILASMSYGKVRKAIEGILTRYVKTDNLRLEAYNAVARVKSGELSWKQYASASKVAARKALKAALRGDFLEAARQREIGLKADEYRKQAQIAIGKINRMQKYITRKMRDTDLHEELKYTGNLKAFESLTSLFNFDKNSVADMNGIIKFINDYGHLYGNLEVGKGVIEMYHPGLTFGEMSMDQIGTVYNLMRNIIGDSKSRLEFEAGQGKVAKLVVNQAFKTELQAHPDRNTDRAKVYGEYVPGTREKIYSYMSNVHAFMQNVNYAVKKLSQDNPESVVVKLIYNQLAGVGDFANTGFGEAANFQLRSDVRKLVEGIHKKYGFDERSKEMGLTRVKVPQFEKSVGLLGKDGKISLLQLLTLTGHAFTEKGRQRISNFQIDPNVVFEVAQTHLTERDMDYMQDVTDIFKTLQERVQTANKIIHNKEIEFVKGDNIKLFGKDYQIDYLPMKYQAEQNDESQVAFYDKALKDVLEDSFNGNIDFSDTSKGMTREGYKEERAETSRALLSLNFNTIIAGGFEDIINDTTMHVPIKNVMRILTDLENKNEIISVIGKEQYKALVCNVLSTGKSAFADRIQIYSQMENSMVKAFSEMSYRYARSLLTFVGSTVIAQTSSIVYMMSGLNDKGKLQYGLALTSTMLQPWKWNAFMNVLGDLDPAFKAHLENIDERNRGGISDRLPKDLPQSKIVRGLRNFDDRITAIGLGSILGTMDMIIKGQGFMVQYQEFLEGRARGGIKKAELEKMTPIERNNAAHAHAFGKTRQLTTSSTTLEKAMFQKTKKLEGWVMFFNDLRNVYNMTAYTGDKAFSEISRGYKAVKNGDLKSGAKLIGGAGLDLLTLQLYTCMAKAILNQASGRDEDGEELPAFETAEWEVKVIEDFFSNFINPLTVPKTIAGSAPLLRDILYHLEVNDESEGRVVTFVAPYQWQVLNKAIKAYEAAKNGLLEMELTDAQQKEIIDGAGAFITFPNRALNKLVTEWDDPSWVEQYSKDPGIIPFLPVILFKMGQQFMTDGNFAKAQELDQVRKTLDPANSTTVRAIESGETAPLNEWDRKVIMQAESAGDQSAVSSAGAAGLYQFTSGTWAGLMRKYPNEGLTSLGRTTSEDQQEKAMGLLTRESASALVRAGLDVTRENIYILHHFGQAKGIQILNLDDSDELPNLSAEREQNPWLDGNVGWINGGYYVKTVEDFKKGINDILNRGEEKLLEKLD